MKFLQKFSGTIIIGAIVGFAGAGMSQPAQAADNEQPKQAAAKQEAKESQKSYSYTANAGDAYTQLVRKAVQTYGIDAGKDIGNARILAIETTASEQAGWPELNEGQVVSFDEATIKAWVDQAMLLSDDSVAAWATYIPYVDFTTNHIGE